MSKLQIISDKNKRSSKIKNLLLNKIKSNQFKKENLIIYHCSNDKSKIKKYPKNIDLVYFNNKKNFLNLILKDLANRKIKNLLIESGTTFCSEMIKANLVDQIAFFRSNKIIGNDGLPFVNNLSLKKISDSISMKVIDIKFFDDDIYELRRFN